MILHLNRGISDVMDLYCFSVEGFFQTFGFRAILEMVRECVIVTGYQERRPAQCIGLSVPGMTL